MALKIAHREMDGVDVLALDGRIDLGEATSALREEVKSLLGEGKKNIVLNLSNVTLIDSSGLGALVAAYSSAKSAGASLRLSNLRGLKRRRLLDEVHAVKKVGEAGSERILTIGRS